VKVLIAHGDATSRQALREVAEDLTALGLCPVECSEGAQTVEMLTGEDAPRLALVDWDLPGCGGPELCRQVRKCRGARSPYIILIAPGDAEVDEAFAAGADDCLRASASGNELQARIVAARRLGALA
jgi:CheY-like chemotaxis protein